jgi:hypothetical protein
MTFTASNLYRKMMRKDHGLDAKGLIGCDAIDLEDFTEGEARILSGI